MQVFNVNIYRGYYMAAQRYRDRDHLVLKKICERVKYFFNMRREISYCQAAM